MKLSLFVPTHYIDALHYASILNVISAARNSEIEVVVSDNSGNDEKLELLKRFESENVRVFKCPVKNNYLFALEKTSCDYVMAVGDDDRVLCSGLPSIIKNMDENPHAIGGVGIYGRDMGDRYEFSSFSGIDDKSFSERIKGLVSTIPIGNPIFHSVIRRDLLIKASDFWFGLPNMQAFHDHLLSLFLCCSGGFCLTDQPYFIYNFTNWKSLSGRMSSELRHLKALNLPPSLALLQRLMLAVEGYYLIQSRYFNVPDDERQKASALWFSEWYKLWIVSLYDGYQEYDEVKRCGFYPLVNDMVRQYRSEKSLVSYEIIESLAALFNEINGSGDRYRMFWINVLSDSQKNCG